MDHSHVVTSEEHALQCIKATIESGIRSLYCVTPFAIPVSLNPMVLPDMEEKHHEQIALFKKFSEQTPLGGPGNDGRLQLGLGYNTIFYRPIEESRELLQFALDNKLKVTFHDVPRYNLPALDFLRKHDLPVAHVTLSHVCDPKDEDVAFVKEKGVGVASTPESEMAMSHGYPSAFQCFRAGCRTGIGMDSPAICSGDMFQVMRLALQGQRVRDNAECHALGKLPNVVTATVDQALYMATLGGAEGIHMEKEIGSLEPGKCADVILIRTDSPSMISSVDLGAAIVMHANPEDVDTVMVNGEVVKRDGKLKKVDWDTLKVRLRDNRNDMEKRWEHIDWKQNKAELVGFWGIEDTLM